MLQAPADAPSVSLGTSCALANDELVLGATATTGKGAVYIYRRTAGAWTLEPVVTANDGQPGDTFGASVALERDTLAVGAPFAEGTSGAVYVFTREAGVWGSPQKLVTASGAAFEFFGWRVALDNGTLVASAPRASNDAGVVHVFAKVGSAWVAQQVLTRRPAASLDTFGTGLAISRDTLVAGAPGANSVAVFTRSAGVWNQVATVTPAAASPTDRVGATVALSGGWLFAAAPARQTGAVFVFEQRADRWITRDEVRASDRAGTSHTFGTSLGVSTDTLLVGASGTPANTGDAHLLRLSLALGESCASAPLCVSGFCVDGVCCNTACDGGAPDDCMACARGPGAPGNGTCGPASATTVCRAAPSTCDVAEQCDGVATMCPADGVVSNGSACGEGRRYINGGCTDATSTTPPSAGDGLAADTRAAPPADGSSHCGCRTAGASPVSRPHLALFAGVLALALALRRRAAAARP